MSENEPQHEQFYEAADVYWNKVEATIDGMLGGFSELDPIDVAGSIEFIKKLNIDYSYALDCGAGIGRVTKQFLSNYFKSIDLVEQNTKLIEQAKKDLKEFDNVKIFYNQGLQDFIPENQKYSIIWIQWVIGHLTDDDLTSFLQRCTTGLKPNGTIIIKDNNSKQGYIMDDEDSSFTRSDEIIKKIIQKANLKLIDEMEQPNFPQGMFKVKMYALQSL